MPSVSSSPLRIAVFASGRGSNFQAIIDALAQQDLPAEIVLFVTNKPNAGACAIAEQHNIPTHVHQRAAFDSSQSYAEALLGVLRAADVNFIALAGYLAMIPERVVQAYRHRIVNIHPSLLPAFGGKGMYGSHVHEAVLAYGARWTGVTVHLVDESYDTGPVIAQEPVRVQPNDTPESLAERVLKVEHRLYPHIIACFANGLIQVKDGRVRVLEAASN